MVINHGDDTDDDFDANDDVWASASMVMAMGAANVMEMMVVRIVASIKHDVMLVMMIFDDA